MSIPHQLRIGAPVTEFPGQSWNAIVEQYWRQHGDSPRKQGTGASHGPASSVPVLVQNTTGDEVPCGGVLAIDGISTDFDANNNLKHQTPLATGIVYAEGKQWGITQAKAADDGIVGMVLVGAAWCNIDILDADHLFAAPIIGDVDKLKTVAGGGVPILWKETGTGEKWAIVLLGVNNGLQKVLITATIDAATWNNGTNKLTPEPFTAKLLYPHTADDGTYTYNTTGGQGEVDAVSFYATDISISTGMARFGYIQNGELIIVDCTEIYIS